MAFGRESFLARTLLWTEKRMDHRPGLVYDCQGSCGLNSSDASIRTDEIRMISSQIG